MYIHTMQVTRLQLRGIGQILEIEWVNMRQTCLNTPPKKNKEKSVSQIGTIAMFVCCDDDAENARLVSGVRKT